MASATLTQARRVALESLAADLHRIFGNRLYSVCAYGQTGDADAETRSIALVDRLSFEDLAACVPLARSWDRLGLAVPLVLERDEFSRTLDVFPLEYGEIIAHHVRVYGDDPFEGVSVAEADVRRGCELQAKGHLIHLREAFLESGGESRAVAAFIGASAPGFRRLLMNLVVLVSAQTSDRREVDVAEAAERHLGIPADLTRDVLATEGGARSAIADPTALLARYLAAVERLWEFVDAWKRA